MKIAVLVKQVPDTETKPKAVDGKVVMEGKFIVSPYDEFAIEEALKIKEKNAGAEVIVISMGPTRVVEAIRTALAMGADRGIHIDDAGVEADSYLTAKVLSGVIKNENCNLVLAGKQAIDLDNGQVTQAVAEFLGWPQVMILEKLEVGGNQAIATRRISGGAKEVYEVALPAIFGCEKGLNTPRYASLPNIMKAKTKPVQTLKAADLKGDASPKVVLSHLRLPPEKAPGKVLKGDTAQVVKDLARLLREEAKVL